MFLVVQDPKTIHWCGCSVPTSEVLVHVLAILLVWHFLPQSFFPSRSNLHTLSCRNILYSSVFIWRQALAVPVPLGFAFGDLGIVQRTVELGERREQETWKKRHLSPVTHET
jgi:hypothetical protein